MCFTADLLEKVGELVDKLFDLDEELMKSWITAQPSKEDDAGESRLDVVSCFLEAAKQLRWELKFIVVLPSLLYFSIKGKCILLRLNV